MSSCMFLWSRFLMPLLSFLLVSSGMSTETTASISNEYMSLVFNEKEGTLQSFQSRTPRENVDGGKTLDFLDGILDEDKAHLPLWELIFANGNGGVTLRSNNKECQHSKTADGLSLEWIMDVVDSGDVVDMVAEISVTLEITLVPGSKVSQWRLSTQLISTNTEIAIWKATILVPTTTGSSEQEGELFFPCSYGNGYVNPVVNTGGELSGRYPSGGAAMQFMAIVDDPSYNRDNKDASNMLTNGLYVAALDLKGITKEIEYTTLDYRKNIKAYNNTVQGKDKFSLGQIDGLFVASDVDPEACSKARNSHVPRVSFLSISSTAEKAGIPWTAGQKYELPYPVGVGVVTGVNDAKGFPLWYQASQMYKDLISPAPWMASKISSRIPDWYRSNSLWLNTHWQCFDVFNETGGDPAVVKEQISKIADAWEEPTLMLHWYEWQQGPDDAPSKRYKFDTHYPDYFPPRGGGDGKVYKDVVQELLEKHSVYTFPYINGRIFDIDSDSFNKDDGDKYCIKTYNNPQVITADSGPPSRKEESYGSGATFCVANPYTSYWQDKIVELTLSLFNDWDSSGVYIDQVSASHPNDCFDPNMGHSIGGGNYFSSGYIELLEQIESQKKQNEQMVITEGNAEYYMGNLQGNLILSTFRTSLAMNSVYAEGRSSPQNFRRLVPAFAAIYGGYFIGMGAEWLRKDWEDENFLCSKLATQFVVGAQLGWFSVIGISDPDYDQSCGPMGVGDLLLSDEHANFIKYMKTVAEARRQAVDYLVDGVLSAPPLLDPIPPVYIQNDASVSISLPPLDYDSVSKSTFTLYSGNTGEEDQVLSKLTILANNMDTYTYEGRLKLDKTLGTGKHENVKIWKLSVRDDIKEVVGLKQVSAAKDLRVHDEEWMDIEVEPRSVLLIEEKA